jgi:hypothetical protein
MSQSLFSFLLKLGADPMIVAVEGYTPVDLMGFVERLPLAADAGDWKKGIWGLTDVLREKR